MSKRQIVLLWATCAVVVAVCGYSVWEERDFAEGMQRTPAYLIAPILIAVIIYVILGQTRPTKAEHRSHSRTSEAKIQREAAEPERLRLTVQLLAAKIYASYPPTRTSSMAGLAIRHRQIEGTEPLDAFNDRAFQWLMHQARLEAFLIAYSIMFSRPGRVSNQPPGEPEFYKFREHVAEVLKPLSRAADDSLRRSTEAMRTTLPETPDRLRVEELLTQADQRRIAFNQRPSVRELAEPYAKLFGESRAAAVDAVAEVLAAHIDENSRNAARLQALTSTASNFEQRSGR